MNRRIILTLSTLITTFALVPLCFAQSSKGSLDDALVAKEREVWEAFKRKDANALKKLLSDDAYEVDDGGRIQTKADQIASLTDLTITDYQMDDIKVIRIDPNAAIIRYRVVIKGSYKGEAFDASPSMASAVWARRGNTWQNVVYHETTIKNP
jgi:glyoxylase I family protein